MAQNWEEVGFALWLDEVEKWVGRKVDAVLASSLFAGELDAEEAARVLA